MVPTPSLHIHLLVLFSFCKICCNICKFSALSCGSNHLRNPISILSPPTPPLKFFIKSPLNFVTVLSQKMSTAHPQRVFGSKPFLSLGNSCFGSSFLLKFVTFGTPLPFRIFLLEEGMDILWNYTLLRPDHTYFGLWV